MIDYRQNLRLMRADFENGKRFTLFLGAGINASENVQLLWNQLISEACEHSFRMIGNNLNLKSSDVNLLLSVFGIKDIVVPQNQVSEDGKTVSRYFFNEILKLRSYASIHFPVEIQVSIIKTLLGDFYIPFLQNYLYGQCNATKIRDYFEVYKLANRDIHESKELYTLYVLARMILLNPQIESVITYNYDNFLSYAMSYLLGKANEFFTADEIRFLRLRYRLEENEHLCDVCPAVDVGDKFRVDQIKDWRSVPVFHVHGYIPAMNQLQNIEESSIVLSMDEYCTNWNDVYSWQITVQEKAIHTSNCMFVGSSLTDLTTKRLLNLASTRKKLHNYYVLDAHDKEFGVLDDLGKMRKVMRDIKNNYLTSLGLNVIDCDCGFQTLFDEISEICDKKIGER